MTKLSIISLATAFALSATGITYAQTSVLGTVNAGGGGADAGVSVTTGGSQSGSNASIVVDLNGDGNISGAEQEAAAALGVNLGNNAALTVKVDANSNGTISEDELAAANVALAVRLGPGATVDVNADGNISNAELEAADAALAIDVGVGSGSGATTASIDINGNGSISAEELAAATVALEIALGAPVTIDLNGDGVISRDEIDAADNALANAGSRMNIAVIACGKSGLEAMISSFGKPDMSVLAAAHKVTVVGVSDCQAGEVSATLEGQGAADIRTVLAANVAAIKAIQARNADLSDVLGATTTSDTITVYVEATTTAG